MARDNWRVAMCLLASGLSWTGRAAAVEDAPPAGWLAEAQRQIAAAEYHASPTAGGLQAPNRAHNLRTFFDTTGIRVHDRTSAGSPMLLSLTLSGVGRGAALGSVRAGDVTRRDGRVEIAREGLLEWYENSPSGLEQGFTLARRAPGKGPLEVELSVKDASASLLGDAVVFTARSGRKLRYDHLVVTDGAGRALVARLAVPAPQRVRIQIEDAGAKYPLTIDPLLTQTADAQLEANQASTSFGISVASAGDVNGDGFADVIVGAMAYDAGQFDEGAAFVFLGSASGIASAGAGSAAARLESDQDTASFGVSVASAGDVNGDGYADVIVGANQFNGPNPDAGAAFVFVGSASGVSSGNPSTAATVLHGPHDAGNFGGRVAGAGDVNGDGYADVIVSDSTYAEVYAYHGSASGVPSGETEVAATLLQASQPGFGNSVAGAGDMNGDGIDDVIVGASLWDSGQTDEGAAFVYYGVSGSGIPNGDSTTADIRLESDQASANFGIAVAGAGDVNGDGRADVIVSAPLYDSGETDEGAVFVFPGGMGATGNPTDASIRIESNQASGTLATSVAGAGDVNGDGYADFILGSLFGSNGEAGEGRAFVFLGGAGGFNGDLTSAYASLESNQMFALLGSSVAGAGDVNGDGYADVIVGAGLYDAGETDEGAAFVYLGGNAGMVDGNLDTLGAHAAVFAAGENDALGFRVASAGDVNGDGYGDIAMGAPGFDHGSGQAGAVFVFHGSANGIDSQPPANADFVYYGGLGSAFGFDVASAGDIDADGYGDLVVGAPLSGLGTGGVVRVYHGSGTGLAFQDTMFAPGSASGFGFGVAGADVNGDGYSDVIVAAPEYDVTHADEGAVFIFHGSATGIEYGSDPAATPAHANGRILGSQTEARLGMAGSPFPFFSFPFSGAVAGAGDVNGDGYSDVIVGASSYDSGQAEEGAAFVFHGGPSGIGQRSAASPDARLESDQPLAFLGEVAAAGDVNRDGHGDVIVGARGYDAGQSDEGAAFVFLGSATGVGNGNPSNADTQLESDQGGVELHSVASAGDVNGDGYADVIVGAPLYGGDGAAFVFLGSSSGIADGGPATAAAQLEGLGGMGSSVSSAGDVNGDGFSDVIVGAPDGSRVGLFLGNAGEPGRRVLARQLRGNGVTTSVQPRGLAFDPDDFQVRLNATHPSGRARAKLEAQACPGGVPFEHASCASFVTPTWTDVTATASGVALTQTLSGLLPGALYRWRARVLRAPFGVTQPGITPPPNPEHGPWRRLAAQSNEGDIRIGTHDDDGDGAPNSFEVGAPNGGDANGDGVADVAQSAVASLPGISGSGYVTVEIMSGCASLTDVSVVSEAQISVQDPSFDYPHGVVGFTVPCNSATLRLFFRGSPTPAPPYRKYGPTTPGVPASAQWYSFPGAVFGVQIVGGTPVRTVTLSLTDDALGDATGFDGVIVDPGGPGVSLIPVFPPGGVAALGVLLAASAAGVLRARRSATKRQGRDGRVRT